MRKTFVFSALLLAFMWVIAGPAVSQVQLPPAVKQQYFDANGKPLAGGCVFSYQSGTTTPLATYTDFSGGTPNPNPVVLGSDGRPPNDIWLLGQAYRLKLVSAGGVSCSTGTQIYVEDGINPSSASLLSSNNVWSGSNTFNGTSNFNGPVNLNVGLTSNGPNTLGGGGSITGTWSGSPTLTGIWNFQAELDAVNIVYSGQLFSSIVTGTPPMVITSTTQVPNLNASLLEGCTWESPCPIGGTTPNTAHFTAIVDTGLFTLGGANANFIKGLSGNLYTAGTIAGGAGHDLCTDSDGSATTSGCATSGITQIESASAVGCTTQGTSFSNCDVVLTWPNAFVDTSYIPTCSVKDTNLQASGGDGSAGDVPNAPIRSFTTTTITVALTTLAGRSISGAANAVIYCHGIHP